MSKEEATELLTDFYKKCDAFRDVLEKLELQIRDILPPLNTGTATGATTEDVADFIADVRDDLDDVSRTAKAICAGIEEKN
ncbi:MAG: hypothetical protein IJQ54_03790 [Kiritimatiellae bacterium]|nr:hypothetical protein [Kiritimatiellia bacterium]